jgi:hypothetical protein
VRYSAIKQKPIEPAHAPAVAQTLAAHLPVLRRYVGETKFNDLVTELVQHFPGKLAAALAGATAAFLRHHPFFMHCPELAELVELQLAFQAALEAPPPNLINSAKAASGFQLVVNAQLLRFSQNTTSIWSALTAGEMPPKPHPLEAEQKVLVWRQGEIARFRLLGQEEADLIEALQKPAALPAAENPAQRQRYIEGWIAADLLEPESPIFLK